ncbi:MAG TPA: hypothetical protein VJP45_11115 [Candidatus Limnocylindria bacterium]|nr:hypothetical protein [Candidatus Limnocylindria bacterium]
MTVPAPTVAWWCKTPSLTVASVRIRAAQVMRELDRRGIRTLWYDPRRSAEVRALVLSRRYDDDTVAEVRRLQARGVRIVLDLCDNNFVPASQAPKHMRKVENLRTLAKLADAITVSAVALVAIVRDECPDAKPATVIGDLADDLSIVPLPWYRRPAVAFKRRWERAWLERRAGAGVGRLVWFGNSGGMRRRSGLQDLAGILDVLETLHRERPLHLTVISNSRARYDELFGRTGFSSRYVEWDPWTSADLLRRQDVALIPAADSSYTACKSDNRVATALAAGVAVVASPVPSYLPYRESIVLGDFAGGLRTYLADPARRRADVSSGRQVAARSTDAETIVGRWREVLAV